jgi:hypothetical protein
MVEMFESSQAFTFFANENLITCKYKSKTLKKRNICLQVPMLNHINANISHLTCHLVVILNNERSRHLHEVNLHINIKKSFDSLQQKKQAPK